jgi:predicted metal-binding membrane protein
MIVLMIVVGLHDLLWMFALAGLMVLQKHVHWGRPFALGTSAAIGAGGLLIVAGWWTPVLYGLGAICRG